MLTFLAALASGVGAVLRYVVDRTVQPLVAEFPVGTFLVNVTGSLLLGFVVGLSLHHGLSHRPAVVLGAGVAGGYTTLSTWAWESLALARAGGRLDVAVNVVGSLLAGMLAAAAGLGLALTW
jgi:CrcB protein